MSSKKTRKLTRKQAKLVEGIVAGKITAQAAREAGYSENKPKNAGQSGYQALKAIADRVRDVMDQRGFTLEDLIEKHLRLVLEGRETKFFPWRKTTKRKTEQIIERVEGVNLMTRAIPDFESGASASSATTARIKPQHPVCAGLASKKI